MQDALFFDHYGALAEKVRHSRPVRVLFLTSLRDIALEEFNGQKIKLDGNFHYMEGVIERTVNNTKKRKLLDSLVEVVGVVVDDTESDLKGKFPLLPTQGQPWIFPTDLKNTDGSFLREKVWNIQSLFRKLPKESVEERKEAKLLFETTVLEKAREVGADVIISDGYMARIDYLQEGLGMYGKILNIHPGPAIEGMPYCFRGKDEVMDAIRFAQANGGHAKTGATLHFVNSQIDEGNAVAHVCTTEVSGNDTENALMYRNYIQAKLPLFVEGMQHYVTKIFPYI